MVEIWQKERHADLSTEMREQPEKPGKRTETGGGQLEARDITIECQHGTAGGCGEEGGPVVEVEEVRGEALFKPGVHGNFGDGETICRVGHQEALQ
jgi:hypothetical protein